MLFDLKTGKRRRFIQIVFGFLAFIFFISFVGFGIGGDVSGGIFDAIGLGGNSSGSASTQYQQQIDDAEDKLAQDPDDQTALLDLTRYRYLAGQEELDQSGELPVATEETRTHWNSALDTWDRYLKTKPKKPDTFLTGQILFVHQLFNDAGGAAEAQAILAEENPSATSFGDLAYYLYFDGELAKGDKAAERAVAEAKQSDRANVKKELDRVAKEARSLQKAEELGGAAEGEEGQLQSPFGGLGPGSGEGAGALQAP
jgi:hypothetical protein